MEAKGIAVSNRVSVTMLGEEAVLPRQDTANARGDVQKPSQAGLVGRAGNTR